MCGEPFGYLVWGIHDVTHEVIGTDFNYTKDVDNKPFEPRLSRILSPTLYFHFDEDMIHGKRVVVLTISAARVVPTSFMDERYIRIGSRKEKIEKHPEREAALFRILNFGFPTLLNTESNYTDLTFDQLFLYYDLKGIKLKKDTFKQSLGLVTHDGKYNFLGQLLSDDSHIPIRFSLFKGKDKTSTMYVVREFICASCSHWTR